MRPFIYKMWAYRSQEVLYHGFLPCVFISRTDSEQAAGASVLFRPDPLYSKLPDALQWRPRVLGWGRTNIRVGIPGFEVDSCSTTPWSDTCQRESVGLQRQGNKRSNGGIRGSRAPSIAEEADHWGCDSVKRGSLPDKSAKGARWTPLFTTAGTSLHTCSLQQIWTVL